MYVGTTQGSELLSPLLFEMFIDAMSDMVLMPHTPEWQLCSGGRAVVRQRLRVDCVAYHNYLVSMAE
jgi:hypothetical protein